MAHFDRFVLRRLSFDGPKVEPRFLPFGDGLNIVWGASNAGKSFIVKALDFMAGGGSLLPNIKNVVATKDASSNLMYRNPAASC
jgi:AAA15 family ATPase/GTPase